MLKTLLKPFQKFLQLQAAGSLLLLLAAVVALIWANSPWQTTYHTLWHTPLSFGVGTFQFRQSLHFWINDALMAVFFFLVGLEIKRELLVGELASPRQASLPIMGAIGGILVPAVVYTVFNPPGSLLNSGWGIPTVTDIAFAVGALAVLGNRVPLGLKVFLIALAIVDDIGAILIIALFYSQGIQPAFLLAAGGIMLVLFGMNRTGINKPWPYALIGIALWFAILKSGLHPTIAGVLLAFTVPASSKINPLAFYQESIQTLERFRNAGLSQQTSVLLTNADYQENVQHLEALCEEVQAPLQKMEHSIHPIVTYGILPLFALANAGVSIQTADLGAAFTSPLTLGILAGLFLGKQLGITLFAWLSVRLKLAELPANVSWRQLHAAAVLGGIGFTMSVFIALLAFQNEEYIAFAKLAILAASSLSGIVGILLLKSTLGSHAEDATEANPSS